MPVLIPYTYHVNRANCMSFLINISRFNASVLFFSRYPPGFFTQVLQFDFFNYAGIHRSVKLYATPKVYVDDITVVTTIDGTTGEKYKH